MSADVLNRLAATIRARRAADAGKSYTKQLLDAGVEKCARKFGEEAIETVLAGVVGSKAHLTAEAADVLFHLLVLLEVRDIAFADVATVLEGRMGTSGLDEKALRSS
jgi:phosphoribosyl-ATP pyrophosphohydrolase